MALPFLDTSVLLRHLLQDDPDHTGKATAILARIESGELQAVTTDTVIFETVFTLQRRHGHSRITITDAVLPLVELPGISLPGKRIYRRVFELYQQTPLGFADCFHVALMERLGASEVLSFDTDFDRISGLNRREE